MFLLNLIKCFVCLVIVVNYTDSYGFGPTIYPDVSEILLNENDPLEIICESSRKMKFYYPSSSSVYHTVSDVEIGESELDDMMILRRNKTVHGDTGWYGCGHDDGDDDGEDSIRWIYVYVKSETHLFVEEDSFKSIHGVISGSLTIPCRPTSPDYQVLLSRDYMPLDQNENIIFNNTLGFTLKNLQLKDSTYYECTITSNNITESNNFHIIVQRAPSLSEPIIIKDPLRHVARGQNLRVNCTTDIEMDIPYDLTWIYPEHNKRISTHIYRKPHVNMTNLVHVTSELQINHVHDDDAGTYICMISTRSGNKTVPMSFIVHDPENQFIHLKTNQYSYQKRDGDTIRWDVFIDAYPTPNIQWFDPMGTVIKGPWPLSDSDKYGINNLETLTTLMITNLQVKDMGVYTVQAKSDDSTIIETLNITLEVHVKPLTQNLENLKTYYMENESVKIHCLAAAFPLPNIMWTFQSNGDPMIDTLTDTVEDSKLTLVNSTVKFQAVSTGDITCTASNYLGSDSVSQTIFLTDVPHGFGIIGPTKKVTIGDSLELMCGVSVYQSTGQIEWLDDNDLPINQSDPRIKISNTKTEYTYRSILSINPVEKIDEKIYKCTAKIINDNKLKSQEYMLYVNEAMKPYFTFTNMNQSESVYKIGKNKLKTIELECNVEGMPEPEITWWKDDVQMNTSDQTPTGICEYVFLNNNQELHIEYLYEKCSGKYLCRAENRLGYCEIYQQIIIKGKEYSKFQIIAVLSALIAALILLIYFFLKMRKERKLRKQLMEAGLTHFEEGALECLNPDLTVDDQAELLPYHKKWEFPRDKLKFGKQLGCGAFGVVMKAEAQGIDPNEPTKIVAVKMVRSSTGATYIRALASELKIMVHLGKHLNVVNLLGACTKNIAKRELLVIVEYCRYGNLHNYLIKHRSQFINQIDPVTGKIDISIGFDILNRSSSVGSNNSLSVGSSSDRDSVDLSLPHQIDSKGVSMSPDGMVLSNNSVQPGWRSNYRGDYKDKNIKPICTQDLLSWAFQVARGMEYLSQRKVLHGDLAARNILLAEDNIVKICDFGLAKTMYNDDNYKKQGDAPLPIKWMAIESIRDRIFSTQSDVWSFGIVLWEFFTLAETPYPGMEAEKQYLKLIEGYRMEKPEYATNEVYNIMNKCWQAKPLLRPTFTGLVDSIGDLLDESVKMHYVDLNTPYIDMNTMLHDGTNNDYLTMMSAPDHATISSATNDYVNQPIIDINNKDTSYICMSPNSHKTDDSGIFSPREKNNDEIHFKFPSRESQSNLNSDSESEALELSPMLKNEDDDNYLKPINVQARREEFVKQRQAMKLKAEEKDKLNSRDSGYCNTPSNLKIHHDFDSSLSDYKMKKKHKYDMTKVHDNYVNVPTDVDDEKFSQDTPDSFTNPSYIHVANIPHTKI
ncbi:vascular endothelial growth factor receptor kdr-like isoform X2 [Aphidius gifuensis]|uniref:vascular endothelial growth factor receptor kdr-like isoform X2 n=1 Tax=Aphidius gifuensis TaxID=684658 RepID=UPI001CDCC9E9|nr:vascular endothelial growth factor receptor kdr-like isoform X2 [Aphidius gifuensis]